VISAEVLTRTALVAIAKLAVLAFSGTVTLAGTVATALPLESETTTPPGVAGAVSVTVPVDDVPPTTDSGLRLRLETVGLFEWTVRIAVRLTPSALAVMTDELVPAVAPVVIVNVAVVAPPTIVTCAGTVATALPLESATTTPPGGAGPLNVTVPVLVEPSRTDAGSRARLESVAVVRLDDVTVSTAERLTPPPTAVIVTDVSALTEPVVTVNVALVDPAGTSTLAGTDAADALLLDKDTVMPPLGAAAVSATVPVADDPPPTDVGLSASEESVGVVGDEVTVQPDSRALVGVAEPSLTSTVQSAGLA
jgi:hypothetical protein